MTLTGNVGLNRLHSPKKGRLGQGQLGKEENTSSIKRGQGVRGQGRELLPSSRALSLP